LSSPFPDLWKVLALFNNTMRFAQKYDCTCLEKKLILHYYATESDVIGRDP
jgi:hypothetical protein